MTEENSANTTREPLFGSNWLKGGALIATLSLIWFGPSVYAWYASSCHYGLVSDVVSISEENKAQAQGVWIIDIVQTQEDARDDKSVSCRGTAVLSNATKRLISYRTFEEHEKWWVKYDAL